MQGGRGRSGRGRGGRWRSAQAKLLAFAEGGSGRMVLLQMFGAFDYTLVCALSSCALDAQAFGGRSRRWLVTLVNPSPPARAIALRKAGQAVGQADRHSAMCGRDSTAGDSDKETKIARRDSDSTTRTGAKANEGDLRLRAAPALSSGSSQRAIQAPPRARRHRRSRQAGPSRFITRLLPRGTGGAYAWGLETAGGPANERPFRRPPPARAAPTYAPLGGALGQGGRAVCDRLGLLFGLGPFRQAGRPIEKERRPLRAYPCIQCELPVSLRRL